jgi:hypothetical protein
VDAEVEESFLVAITFLAKGGGGREV